MKMCTKGFQSSVPAKDPGGRLLVFAWLVLLCCPLAPQSQSAPDQTEERAVAISDDDFTIIAQEIKSLDDPTFRAFLRAKILAWLRPDNDELRFENVRLVVSDGLADIKAHEDQIAPATAALLRGKLIRSAATWSASEADALARKYPLRASEADKDDPVKRFSSALAKLNDVNASAQTIETARKAVTKNNIPPGILFGELLRLEKDKSTYLPQMLAAVLSLEENQTGAIPLHFLNLFRFFYLKDTTAAELRIRYLTLCVKATRLSPVVFNDPKVRGPAIEILTISLPYIEKLAPPHYAEAAGRLQELNSNSLGNFKNRQAAENRISKSDRPLEQTITEANETSDKLFRRDLFQRAARLAKNGRKWRQAVDLMVSSEPDTEKNWETKLARDEFLAEIIESTLRTREMEASEYAASKMQSPLARSMALRDIAVRHFEQGDIVSGQHVLEAGARVLGEAGDSQGKAQAALSLAVVFQKFHRPNAHAAFEAAIVSINRVSSSKDNTEPPASRSLLPLAEDVIKSFRILARHDRAGSLALSTEIRVKELKTAAAAGIVSIPIP